MFNQSGRLVKKKKTTVQLNSKDPVFNETLNFEVSPHQLESCRFLIALCSRKPDLDMEVGVVEDGGHLDSSDQDGNSYYVDNDRNGGVARRDSQGRHRDICFGKIAIGKTEAHASKA